MFLKLPYVIRKCEDFAFRLKALVNEIFPKVEFNVAFQAPMTIGKMFPFKDKIKNVMEQSMVVYSFTCKCGAEYIGKTERILHYRVKEHANPDSTSAISKICLIMAAINKRILNEKTIIDLKQIPTHSLFLSIVYNVIATKQY
jgi:hypothetical protein